MKIKTTLATFITSLSLLLASPLSATVILEDSDAGQTLATAQLLPEGTSEVWGSIADANDVDLYGFAWNCGEFSADTFLTESTLDTQLFLFDALGAGLWSNDDSRGLLSEIYLAFLSQGSYFIAVTGFDNDPLNEVDPSDVNAALIFPNEWEGQYAPSAADTVLADWSGGNSTGDYVLRLSPSTGAFPVPEPSTLFVPLLGGVMLAFRMRKRS